MTNDSNVKFTLQFTDPDANDDERDSAANSFLAELEEMDGVEASRVRDPNPPAQAKGAGFLVGLLAAEVNPANIKNLFGYLSQRLGDKPIELEVEANGKKLKVKASSQAELQAAIAEAQKFVSA